MMKSIISYLQKHVLLVILLLSLLPLVALLKPGLPVTHDGQDHVARIANFYLSLKEGNLVPRWAANLNWGYGHPILMFLYPLPSYIASLFHFIGLNLVDSTKLVFGLAFIASAVTMYIWMNTAFGSTAALLGALLYAFAPYRFVDLYVRGDLGEHVAFVFPPLVFYFLYTIAHQIKKNRNQIGNGIGLTFSFAALIMAHNAIAVMFLPIILLYMVYLFFTETENRWLAIGYSASFLALGFGLAAFFWIPAYFEGKYTLRDIVTAGEALKRFVPWQWFFYSPWNYGGGDQLTKSLGFPQWFGIIVSLILLIQVKDRKIRILLVGTLILLLASLFIMTSWSAFFWKTITFLQKFQFPWRFLAVSLFCAAVLGGVGISNMFRAPKNLRMGVCVVCVIWILGATIPMWHPRAYQVIDQTFYSGIYPSTTDTGESSPIWSVRFMEHGPIHNLEVVDGVADITVIRRNTTDHEYFVVAHKPTLMMENTVYFPGWAISVDGTPAQIQYQNPNYRGLMMFDVPAGRHTIEVKFGATKLRQVADLISLLSLGMLAAAGIGGFVWQKRK